MPLFLLLSRCPLTPTLQLPSINTPPARPCRGRQLHHCGIVRITDAAQFTLRISTSIPRPSWTVSRESIEALRSYDVPRTDTLETASVSVPVDLVLGAEVTSVMVPWTVDPAGIATQPPRFLTSSTTLAVKASPAFHSRELMVWLSAASTSVPAARV